jgi:hypothetical protein
MAGLTLADLGGPVHPQETQNADGSVSVWCGMNLRDYFAAAALQGLMGNSGGPWQADPMCGTGWCNSDASLVALTAYDIADAMLAARERKESSNG